MRRARGRPETVRASIVARAAEMRGNGEVVNKSRIARELHVSLRHVRRVLPFCAA